MVMYVIFRNGKKKIYDAYGKHETPICKFLDRMDRLGRISKVGFNTKPENFDN